MGKNCENSTHMDRTGLDRAGLDWTEPDWGLNRGIPLSACSVDRLGVIRSDLEESHNTRAPPTDEFEANAAWSRLIDYRIARHCLTTGWSSIVPSHGLSVKKRTNHDGVGCYSNMAARQYAALEARWEEREGLSTRNAILRLPTAIRERIPGLDPLLVAVPWA